MEAGAYITESKKNEMRRCIPVFQALADEHRLEILFLLLENGRLNVKEISACMSISRPAISHHLKILRQADIVRHAKTGVRKYYFIHRGEESPLTMLQDTAVQFETIIQKKENP